MIKIIYGKTGEGKTWEVINEILQIEKGLKVGILQENTLDTFFGRLGKVMSPDEIINKKLFMVNQTLTPKEALENIKDEDFDVFIIDVNHPSENYIDELRESKIPKIIITQQIKTRINKHIENPTQINIKKALGYISNNKDISTDISNTIITALEIQEEYPSKKDYSTLKGTDIYICTNCGSEMGI